MSVPVPVQPKSGYGESGLHRQPGCRKCTETLSLTASLLPGPRWKTRVRADRALQSLQKRGLIQEVGRKNAPGRPVMYGTTEEFLKLFGLTSLQDLPAVLEEGNDD